MLFAEAARRGRLDAQGWRAASIAADAIRKRRGEKDEGIWDTGAAHWTHSRLICAAGLKQIARNRGGGEEQSSRWLALADTIIAECEAARWFERARAACGPPGLLAEEFDAAQRQFRGNLPQAFVHAELLACSARLGSLFS